MKRHFLLIDPGLKLLYNRKGLHADVYFPRGALSLVSYLAVQGISCTFLPVDHCIDTDAPFEANMKTLERVLDEALRASSPSLVGVSCVFTMQYPLSLRILEMVKGLRPGVPTVIGGTHVTFRDRECLEEAPWVDYVVRGEGEWTLHELFHTVAERLPMDGVEGITWRKGALVVQSPPRALGALEELPIPDYSHLPDEYLEDTAINIIASRGCAFRCSYCVEQRFWRNRVRRMPADRIIDEITMLASRNRNLYFTLEDSMFFVNSPYFMEFCRKLEELRDRNFTIGYIVSRVDTVSAEGLEAMKRAGIEGIIFGIESASPRVLQAMNKQITLEEAREACRLSSSLDLKTGTFWLFGHPGDSPQEAQLSLDTIEEFYRDGLHTGLTASMFVPYPGTEFFESPSRFGLEILSEDWEKWGRFNEERVCQLDGFTAEEITDCYRRAMDMWGKHSLVPQLRVWMEKNIVILPRGVRLLRYDLTCYGIPSQTQAIQNILEVAKSAYPLRFAATILSMREIALALSDDLALVYPALTLMKEAASAVGATASGDLHKAYLRKAHLSKEDRETVTRLVEKRLTAF